MNTVTQSQSLPAAPQTLIERLLGALGLFQDESRPPRMPWTAAVIGIALVGLLFGVYRWYQQVFSFSVGLDYFEPEFKTYWMNLLYAQGIIITLIGVVGVPLLWFTRPAQIVMSPRR